MTRPLKLLLPLLLLTAVLSAQSSMGRITGIVSDSSGAPVPNCEVMIVNQNTSDSDCPQNSW